MYRNVVRTTKASSIIQIILIIIDINSYLLFTLPSISLLVFYFQSNGAFNYQRMISGVVNNFPICWNCWNCWPDKNNRFYEYLIYYITFQLSHIHCLMWTFVTWEWAFSYNEITSQFLGPENVVFLSMNHSNELTDSFFQKFLSDFWFSMGPFSSWIKYFFCSTSKFIIEIMLVPAEFLQ